MDVSLNQLTELTGKGYRTIKQRVHDLPYKEEGVSFLYDSSAALLAIYTKADNYDYNRERARLTHAQANEKELQVKILEGDLVPSEQVLAMLETVIANARAKLLTLPIKAAQVAINATDLKEIEREIQTLVYESLSELNNGSNGNSIPSESGVEASTSLNS